MNEITNEQAINEIEQSGLFGNQIHEETMRLALTALREKQEREKGCKYCKFEEYRTENMELRLHLIPFSAAKFKFCPVCGRRLPEPAKPEPELVAPYDKD